MEASTMILLFLLFVILAFIVYLLFGMKGVKQAAAKLGGMGDYVVDFDASGGMSYDANEYYEDEYSGGAAAKKAAAKKPAKKAAEKKEDKAAEHKPAEHKPAEHPHPQGDKPAFRGHFLSERVIEKHDPETGLVTTYRVSVRGDMKDTHRVLMKIKDITKGKDGRKRKLKLKANAAGDYDVIEKPEQNNGTFKPEEKETAIRILHGALGSSMLDIPTREKIVALITKKL